jgi:hypothetical protein
MRMLWTDCNDAATVKSASQQLFKTRSLFWFLDYYSYPWVIKNIQFIAEGCYRMKWRHAQEAM